MIGERCSLCGHVLQTNELTDLEEPPLIQKSHTSGPTSYLSLLRLLTAMVISYSCLLLFAYHFVAYVLPVWLLLTAGLAKFNPQEGRTSRKDTSESRICVCIYRRGGVWNSVRTPLCLRARIFFPPWNKEDEYIWTIFRHYFSCIYIYFADF